MTKNKKRKKMFMFVFMKEIICLLKELGKTRSSESYTATLNSFKRFRNNEDLLLSELNEEMLLSYEVYLKTQGLCPNTTSFYMRNLRAVYNRAVEKGIIFQQFPFKHVYTGIDKTIKRALPLHTIKKIKHMDLSHNPSMEFARDMFLFSFYMRGMSFIDMAYLKKKDLKNGILSYRRRKTGKLLTIKWESCMQELVDKYGAPQSPYMLPIIQSAKADTRKQYLYQIHNINRHLKSIGSQLKSNIPLTLYVARHSWASIAKNRQIPLSVISEGMGHDSEKTTLIYLATLDTSAVDKANNAILKLL